METRLGFHTHPAKAVRLYVWAKAGFSASTVIMQSE